MNRRVLVMGGDISGWIAALHLSSQGFAVTILTEPESTRKGIAFLDPHVTGLHAEKGDRSGESLSVALPDPWVIFGSQRSICKVLQELRSIPDTGRPEMLHLEFSSSPGKTTSFRTTPFPYPFNIVFSLLRFPLLSWKSRFNLLNHLEKLWEHASSLPPDLDLRKTDWWLQASGQEPASYYRVWNPLCHCLFGSETSHLSAGAFLQTLRHYFSEPKFPKRPFLFLSDFTQDCVIPLKARLKALNVDLVENITLRSIHCDSTTITGVESSHGSLFQADWYISTLRPARLLTLLSERTLAKFSYFYHLSQLDDSHILRILCSCPEMNSRSRFIIGPGTFQWIIFSQDHHYGPYISLYSSEKPEFRTMPDNRLAELAVRDLRQYLPPQYLSHFENPDLPYHILRHSRPRFLPYPGSAVFRPPQQSPVKNFLLAGDWTDTGLSGGVESALVSGTICAEHISRADIPTSVDILHSGS